MAIDEIERTAMVQQLINTLGEQPANTLMKCILPDGADQVATKADIHALQAATSADIHALQVATKADIHALEARLRAEFKTDLAELTRTIASQNRTLMFTMAGFMITIWGTVLALGLS
ncbi:hypothetical protein [Candidatus Poriferisodalis sp.]|uniref:hypothetical protein n=1 Tax=Candidatus Poriferisodalis sp. TaxID=3101277 RepID=UPI003B02EB40